MQTPKKERRRPQDYPDLVRCEYCNAGADGCTNADGSDDHVRTDGCINVCGYCAGVNIFEHGQLRRINDAEKQELRDHPEWLALVRTAQRVAGKVSQELWGNAGT